MMRYAISDRHAFAGSEQQRRQAVVHQALLLAQQGVDFFQLREKDMAAADLLQLARTIRLAVAHTSMQVVLNGQYDVAQQAGVAWHRTSTCLDPRNLALPALSTSCHTVAEVLAARDRTRLILFGPVFEKTVAATPGVGLQALHTAVRAATPTPVLALGGVTAANLGGCLDAGAQGVAAIRLFLS